MASTLAVGCASPGGTPSGAIFYPPPPAQPRLQLLGTFSRGADIRPSSSFRKFVVGTEQEQEIVRAHGVAWQDGRMYVCDPGTPHVVIFDFETKEMRPIDPKRPNAFKKCIEIAIAPDGKKYITDTGHRQVLVYSREDRFQGAFGVPEEWKPVGVTATSDKLYVTDTMNHQIVVLDRRSGKIETRWGAKGSAEGSFYYPLSIAPGPDGDLYVSDSFNFRVQRFKPNGTFVRAYGQIGTKPGSFARPRGVAVDPEGRMLVVDAAFENVQIFDNEGSLLLFFGEPGEGPGAVNLPASVRISRAARAAFADRVAKGRKLEYVLFVTSQTGPNKVNVYGMLRSE